MPDTPTRTPEEVIARTPPTVPAVEADDFEVRYKARLKQELGLDDAPAIKERLSQHEQYAKVIPQYEAVTRALLLERQSRDTLKPAIQPTDDEDAKLEELGRINPVAATRKLLERERARQATEIEQERQRTHQVVTAITSGRQAEADAGTYLQAQYPEVYQAGSELHTEGQRVYQSRPYFQQSPDGFREATEIAAARLGILPKSKRSAPATRDVQDEVSAQNVGRPSRRAESSDDEPAKLTARERQMAENMDVDPKVVAQAKAARLKGRNVRVS